MLDIIHEILDGMKPLKSEKDPTIACVVGFLFGSLGLGIYFQSFIDFVMPLFFLIVANLMIGELGLFTVWILTAVYGYHRAISSNAKLASPQTILAR